ncbi:uncharacterized protein C8Q71DRAFT_728037 [Rhodofomes roseus]|uniref:TPX2 C-terminal domain-containing protein n=1 Tax=Rhodofomes roseus TaxID=34475 RepID=A0ABQ8JYT0_9APHY|nr:uncharacterized protein C8Q71DRAFT_728037 [Rhodofomes roseus]KAH9829434.1 hypothetical protein C8Q71DRAFT_728037 [Rhodofomes roseus]
MVAEVSMRHFPDFSDASLDQDFSESSFQIPTAGGSNDLLMDEDSITFLPNADNTLSTPMGTDYLLDTQNNINLSDCADITLSAGQQLCPTSSDPLTLCQLSPQFNESLSEHSTSSTSRLTPEPVPDEPLQARAENASGSIDRSQGIEPLAIQDGTTRRNHEGKSEGVEARDQRIPIAQWENCISNDDCEATADHTKQRAAASSMKTGDAQKSKVLSNDGGKGTVGGLASTLMSYGLRLTDNLASSNSQQATEPVLKTNLAVAPVVTAPMSKCTSPDMINADTAGAAGDGSKSEGQGQFERLLSEPRSASPEAYRDTDRRTDLPLTLSQLSPTKAKPSEPSAPACLHQAPGGRAPARPPSPTRPPTKRLQSAAASSSSAVATSSQNKRSKTAHAPKPETHSRTTSSSSQTSYDGRGRAPGAQGTSQNLTSQPSNVHVRHPSADQAAKTKTKAGASLNARERAASGSSTSRSSANADEDGKRAARGQLTDTRAGAGATAGSSRSGDSATLCDSHKENQTADGNARRPASAEGDHAHGPKPTMERSASTLPPAKPTKPIEFHFRSDARIEARKAEPEKSSAGGGSMGMSKSRSHAPLLIPDFKAMHAAQEAAHAARREHIVPVKPQEIEFSTEARSKGREKFEEARRAREREIELQMEERRRLREIEEEKEIRELRKRAVPKAHEVPEWYADAPKRPGKAKS